MTPIEISDEIKQKCPHIALGCIECAVEVKETPPELSAKIEAYCNELTGTLEISEINERPAIRDTRAAYKALGKEPSRYRPSAEALCRRAVKGKGLYRVNNVVDLLNLVSLRSGFSIGGWDAERIAGTAVLGIGREEEPYRAIGRGELNIAYLPLFRDDQGAFGTPTSDSQRTMVRPETKRFLMVIYAFGGEAGLEEAMRGAVELLRQFADAAEIEQSVL